MKNIGLIDFGNCAAKISYKHDRFGIEDNISVLFLVPSHSSGEIINPPSELYLDNILALRELNQYLTEYLNHYEKEQKEREQRERESAAVLLRDTEDE